MIKTLRISRFKSIRELTLDCKRINLFIGEPNTGKSNILETLGMFSFLYYGRSRDEARQFVRFERTSNLFYDEVLDEPLEIQFDTTSFNLEYKDGGFDGHCLSGGEQVAQFGGDHNNIQVNRLTSADIRIAPFKFYRCSVKEAFPRPESDFLLPPSGDNLLSLLLSNRELRSVVNQPFSSMGLRLGLRPQENKIEVVKSLEDIIISYPYSLTSETLQRLTFYLAAILSNKNSVLV